MVRPPGPSAFAVQARRGLGMTLGARHIAVHGALPALPQAAPPQPLDPFPHHPETQP